MGPWAVALSYLLASSGVRCTRVLLARCSFNLLKKSPPLLEASSASASSAFTVETFS